MKLVAAVASFLRSSSAAAMLVLLPLLLIGWAEEAVAHPFHRALSPALRSEETYQNVEKVAREVGCDLKQKKMIRYFGNIDVVLKKVMMVEFASLIDLSQRLKNCKELFL